MSRPPVTLERLREVLHCDPETGIFAWRVDRGTRKLAGSVAGYINAQLGYVMIRLDGRMYLRPSPGA